MKDDDFDRACAVIRQQATQIRRAAQQLAKVPLEQLPPRAVLEEMQADLHRTSLQLRQLLQAGIRQ